MRQLLRAQCVILVVVRWVGGCLSDRGMLSNALSLARDRRCGDRGSWQVGRRDKAKSNTGCPSGLFVVGNIDYRVGRSLKGRGWDQETRRVGESQRPRVKP